ncbi:hypothetical protein CMI41_03870 [Candidatus Pacearchaeota archaeon]|jgi:hypothetical protein|nr:hypothetical protein [Candidatus Pacearchaeota archaeon]|tara:strand:+ start:2265 stop:2465 length:201 start_codon:yes stop_codon:yes gene_type:complete
MTITGYCVVCKEKQIPMKDAEMTKTSRGGYMAKGICTKCNKTKMCAMMSKDNAEKAMADGEAKKAF